MFNLIKITNGRSNVPEPARLKTTGEISYVAGCVYYLAVNDVLNAPETEDDLLFIPLENVDVSEGKKTVLGYIVTEGMVFETEIKNDYTLMGVGDTVCFYTDNNFLNTEGHCGVFNAPINVFGVFNHQAVVAVKVRLTLCAVYD